MIRHDWTVSEIQELYQQPLMQLVEKAHAIHIQTFPEGEVQKAKLLNIKTGACPEDCKYCSQSIHNKTAIKREKLMSLAKVKEAIETAKAEGATRLCMGAAWRSPRASDLNQVIEMIQAVKEAGMESCVTLGMLTAEQANQLKLAGLDYYNHNLDTSPEYYESIISTRTYQDRLDTLQHVRQAGINVCCGGIMGMGETDADRISFLHQLAIQNPHPESVPLNNLIPVAGTPLENQQTLSPLNWVRMIALARILMPKSYVRLAAGRKDLSEEGHFLCFYAGANSIFWGDELLTEENSHVSRDEHILAACDIKICSGDKTACAKRENECC